MVTVVISPFLEREINDRCKGESVKVFTLLLSLQEQPKKGKIVGTVGAIVIEEIKYGVYRFYFITDGYKVKVLNAEELSDVLIKVVRMSDKDGQEKIISEIKAVVRQLGTEV